MKKFLFLLMVAMTIFLVGCGGQSGGQSSSAENEGQSVEAEKEVFPPEDVNEGVDRCDVCNMLVPNDHNATQIVLNDGRSLKFDDIGCMVVWEEDNGLDDVNARYVRDYHTEEWILIEGATFAYDYTFRTPMAYGVIAFANKEEAEKFVEEEGKGVVLSYEDLQNHTWERNMEMMQMMKEEMGHHHDHDHDMDGDHDHMDHDQMDTNHDEEHMQEGHQ